MKIRNGFVSNSSSSSFIIGIAKVNDIDKLRKYVEKKGINIQHYFQIISKYDLEQNKPWEVQIRNDEVVLESFMGNDVILNISNMNGLDIMVIYDFNGHSDSDFWNDYDYDYDYDVDLNFFGENEKMTYNMFFDEESGLDTETSQINYGAGRNG